MPPPNDDFGSATVISGRSGSALGTNVDAADNAVWWEWTAPPWPDKDGDDSNSTLPGYYFFTTHADINHGITQLTDFDSVLALHLNEATPLPTRIANSGDDYGLWSQQSYAVCRVSPGDTVYIKVSGKSGAEGNIRLVWGQGARRFNGGAGIVRARDPFTPVASATVSTITAENTVPFDGPYGDTFAAGNYMVRYIDGAWAYEIDSDPDIEWATARFNSTNGVLFGAGDDCFIQIEHSGGSGHLPFTAIPKQTGGAEAWHPNETHAADWARGAMMEFYHSGGGIDLHFIDDEYTDNMAGTTLPRFMLYRIQLQLQAIGVVFGTVGTSADSLTFFRVRNTSNTDYSSIEFTLAASGGITSPSSPVTTNLPANTTVNVGPFSYNVSTVTAIATLTVDGADDLDFAFTPSITIGNGTTPAFSGSQWFFDFPLTISTGATRNLSASVVSSSGMSGIVLDVQDGSHASDSSITLSGYVRVSFDPTGAGIDSITIELTDGSLNFGQKSASFFTPF